MVLFNKSDSPESRELSTLVDECGVKDFIKGDIIVKKCSAKTGEGLFEALSSLNSFFNHHVEEKHHHNNKK